MAKVSMDKKKTTAVLVVGTLVAITGARMIAMKKRAEHHGDREGEATPESHETPSETPISHSA